ncbi:MAG: GAF domain-containing sensor histidine kinase [Candidatus Dojkabacteria bacterium]
MPNTDITIEPSPFDFTPKIKGLEIPEAAEEFWIRSLDEFIHSVDEEVLFLLEDPNIYTNIKFQNNIGQTLKFSNLQELLLKLLPDNYSLPADLLKVARDGGTLTGIKLQERSENNANIYCDMVPFWLGSQFVGFKFRFRESFEEEALNFREIVPKANELFQLMSMEAGANAYSLNIEIGKKIDVEDIIIMFLNTKQLESWDRMDEWVEIEKGIERATLETIIVPEDIEGLVLEIQALITKYEESGSEEPFYTEIVIKGFDTNSTLKRIKQKIIIQKKDSYYQISGCTIDITKGFDNAEYLGAMLRNVEELTSLSDYGEQLQLIEKTIKEIVPDISTIGVGRPQKLDDGTTIFNFDIRKQYDGTPIKNFDILQQEINRNRKEKLSPMAERMAKRANSLMLKVVNTKKICLINYKDKSEESNDLYELYGILDYIGIPIIVDGKVIAVINFSSHLPVVFTNEVIEKLNTLSRFLSIAMEKESFVEALKEGILSATNDLQKATLRLQEAMEIQKKILELITIINAAATHDLMTPITVLKNQIYLIKKVSENKMDEQILSRLKSMEAQLEIIERIARSASNDYVSITQISNAFEIIDLPEVILGLQQDANSLVLNYAPLKKTVVDTPNSDSKPERVKVKVTFDFTLVPMDFKMYTNRDAIVRVVQNLMSNAIKYLKDEGEGIVKVKFRIIDENLEFSIEDNGIGIPQKFQDEIMFKKNGRAGNVAKRVGSGAGLKIIQTFIESLKGTIRYESEENKGTKVFIKIPLRSDEKKNQYLLQEG